MPWNPDQYHKFQSQRAAPFEDLLRMIVVRPNLRVIDLGCGTGELTARLADALPDSDVLGVDSSAQMLAKAQPHARAGLRFEQADLAAVEGAWDLVFSHAAIQWVDDHAALIPRLWQLVAPGGQMAIQQPANHDHLSHVFARELAAEEPFRTALNGWVRIPPVMPMDRYAQMLFDLGAEDMTVLEKIYPHVLENADAIAEWTSGTLLVPYFERLGDLRDNFMAAYRARLREAFPGSPVFYPFRRMLFTAHRPH
ncbi:MAG: methyltransferase domain-containing protein [Anaerolineae bacterium]|nr:methyltransferase domain-containing protein [Anaerolineae bacterium]